MTDSDLNELASQIARNLAAVLPKDASIDADAKGTIFVSSRGLTNGIDFADLVRTNMAEHGHDSRTAVRLVAQLTLDQIKELTDDTPPSWPPAPPHPSSSVRLQGDVLVLTYEARSGPFTTSIYLGHA